MTFREVAYKNFTANLRRYLAYFLSSSFSIMIFFMYATLVFNPSFEDSIEEPAVYATMAVCMMVVGVFSTFFITYAHSSFIKSRSREFGLFLTLGMSEKDVGRLIKTENAFIALLSMGLGLVTGTVFSRIFFLVTVKTMDLQGIRFELNYKSYALTAMTFLIIFAVVNGVSRLLTRKMEISNLLKCSRRPSEQPKGHPVLGFLGILSLAAAFILLDLHVKGEFLAGHLEAAILLVILCLAGLYLAISQLGALIIAVAKRRKDVYYRHLLDFTSVYHRFEQNKRILFVMCILSGMVIYFLGGLYAIYSQTLDTVVMENPYHLMVVERMEQRELFDPQINRIIAHSDTPAEEEASLEFIQGDIWKAWSGREGWNAQMMIVSQEEYNALAREKVDLKRGEAVTLLRIDKPESSQWFDQEVLKIRSGSSEYDFQFKKEIYDVLFNTSAYLSRFMIIINSEDYAALEGQTPESNKGQVRLFNFKDWHEAEDLAAKINELMYRDVEGGSAKRVFVPNEIQWGAASRMEAYKAMKWQTSFTLFLMSFIGFLFFIASGSVLYFKLYTEIEDLRMQYKRLFRIGIRDQEMKGVISRELRLVFFAPLLIGSLLGYAVMFITTTNMSMQKDLIVSSLVVLLVYTLFQTLYYLGARNRHVDEVLNTVIE